MKRRLSMILAAIAMLATSASYVGCPWLLGEEPESKDIFTD